MGSTTNYKHWSLVVSIPQNRMKKTSIAPDLNDTLMQTNIFFLGCIPIIPLHCSIYFCTSPWLCLCHLSDKCPFKLYTYLAQFVFIFYATRQINFFVYIFIYLFIFPNPNDLPTEVSCPSRSVPMEEFCQLAKCSGNTPTLFVGQYQPSVSSRLGTYPNRTVYPHPNTNGLRVLPIYKYCSTSHRSLLAATFHTAN